MTATAGAGVNAELLRVLPAAANVLELGCADGRLGEAYKQLHPGVRWTGVDFNEGGLRAAQSRLDRVVRLDLESDAVSEAGSGFDLVVLGDVLEHLRQPERVLAAVHAICSDGATLAMCMPNLSHVSVLERMIAGDVMYDDHGLLDRTHVRLFAPRSVFKMLLDCGWLPTAAGGYHARHPNQRFEKAVIEAARALGASKQAAELNVCTYQLVIASRRFDPPVPPAPAAAPFSVVVRVRNEAQFALNVPRSPGLIEIGAPVMPLRDAASAAAAFDAAVSAASTPWIMICTDDVYLPHGSGARIAAALGAIPHDRALAAPVGFLGIALDERERPFRAGLAVDRMTLIDAPASGRAVALADFAVLLHRDAALRIDAELSWDFWATDLALQAASGGTDATVLRVPVYRNGFDDASVTEPLLLSGMYLTEKYPQLPVIPTPFWNVSRDDGLQPYAAPKA